MKKFNLIEWLSRNSHEKQKPQRFGRYAAMLIMLLTLGVGQMWAGDECGFWSEGSGEITFTANGSAKTMSLKSDGVSNYTDIGTVTTLNISSFWMKTWKTSSGNVCQVEMYYAIHTTRNSWAGDDSDKHQLNALHDGTFTDYWDNGKYQQQWKHTGSTDVLDGLTPGTTYWIDFYFEIQGNSGGSSGCYGAQKSLNNNGGNYHASFTYAEEKATFKAGQYIYFDGRNQTSWDDAAYTTRFFFKRYDKDNVDVDDVTCAKNDRLENWVYYAVVPAGYYTGKIQLNRVNPDKSPGEDNYWWNNTNIVTASSRTSAAQNCLDGASSSWNDWSPGWTTYCPPTTSESFSDNSTSKISWQDEGNDGSTSGKAILVKTGTTLKVTASASKAVPDGDMTVKYDFKVNSGSVTAQTSGDYTSTASTNNTSYDVQMQAYTNYNLDNTKNSTKSTAKHLYYKALNMYSVTHTIPGVTKTAGRAGTDAAAYNLEYTATYTANTGYTLPDAVTVTIGGVTKTVTTDYTWSVSEDIGTLTILTNKISGNVVITVNGVADTYTDAENLNKNGGDSHGQYTATYDATMIEINTTPGKANYHVEGYYLEPACTTQIADASGNLLSGVEKSSVTYTDADGKWKKTSSVTLYTKWEENSFTVTINAGSHGSVSTTSVTGHPITASSNFTVTADAGYAFSHWTFSEDDVAVTTYVSTGGTNNATQTFNVTTTAAVTMTANYVVRYGLYGSLDTGVSGDEAGMPGWSVSADFTYSAGSYTITRTLTAPNTNYKFRILDRRNNFSYGFESDYTFVGNSEVKTLNSGNYNAYLATAGKGSHTLTVTEASSGAYPAVQITSHPESYVVHFGKKAFTPDGDELGDLAATITVSDGTNTYADGKYIAKDETVTVTASDVDGYTFVGWFADDSYSYEFGDKENPHSWTVSEAVNAYAKYEEDANIFEGDVEGHETEWSQGDNWSKGQVPRISDVVYINKPVIVNTSAKAKRVIISNNGDTKTGKLTINAGKKLIVAQTIRKYDGSSLVATTENDLVINSDGTNGVGALVWGKASTSPGAATVNFYSVSGGSKGSTASVNQFIGTPFTSETSDWLYNYYNSWVLGVNYESTPVFYLLGVDDSMEPFKGYCIIYNGTTGHTYNMSGTLVTNADYTCSSLSHKGGTAESLDNENLLANPWLAPIKINAMQASDFDKADATIYIFNSTSKSASKTGKGNYTGYTVGTAEESDVIPAMQSFSVFTSGFEGSVALDYSKIVYDPAVAGINPVANKAPKRIADEEADKVRLYVHAESGYGDMVYMWERSDFNEGFENGWDGHKIAGDKEAPQFYAITPDGNMAVNCVPDFEGTVMGFKAGTEDNTYTFSFEYNNEDDALYLYDIDENKYTRVLEGNTYTFSTTDKTEHNRFILTRNMPQNPTGIENESVKANGAVKFFENGKLFIFRNGRLYDATGLLVK